MAPLGLMSAQARLVWEVRGAEGDGGPTLRALAGRLAVQTSAVTHALRSLLGAGLVAIRPEPGDRRQKRAALTPLGEARLHEMAVVWLEAALGPAAAARLRALADAVASPSFLEAYEAGAADAASARRLPLPSP